MQFKKVDKKRGAIYSIVAIMLCSAVYLNWNYASVPNEALSTNKNYGDTKLVDKVDDTYENGVTQVINENDNFANAKITRQKTRDEAINILNETINNEKTTDEAKDEASKTVKTLSQNTVAEGTIETLICAKGFDKSVVFISDDGVNVLVSKADEFTAVDAAIIRDIVVSETSISADKIKIVESK